MTYRNRIRAGVSSLALVLGSLPFGHFASAQSTQQAEVVGLEEVVVTARRREESLMEVPLAITSVSSEAIAAAGIKDLNTLASYTPGLWAEWGAATKDRMGRQLTFRGLSVSSGQLFIDGAPYTGNGQPNMSNVERIEVLVGPQSVYFGRSTYQGAVNYVNRAPSNSFQGSVAAEYGQYGLTDDAVSFEGPLIADKLAFRINGRYYSTSGQYKNVTDGSRLGDQSTRSLTTIFELKPTDTIKARLLLEYVKDEDGQFPAVALKGNKELFCQAGGTYGAYACGPLPDAKAFPGIISQGVQLSPFLSNLLFNNTQKYPTYWDPHWLTHTGLKQVTLSAHLNLDYEHESGWAVSSVTAIHKTRNGSVYGANFRDPTGLVPNPIFPGIGAPNPNAIPQFIGFYGQGQTLQYDGFQELRVTSPQKARVRGTLGASFYETRNPGGSVYGLGPAGYQFTSGSIAAAITKTPGIFGGLYYDVLDDVTLTGEARYQWDHIDTRPKYPTPGPTLGLVFKSFSPRVSVDWKFQPNSTIYALWSKGYKPGVANTALIGQPQAVVDQFSAFNAQPVSKQESLENFEFGVKGSWLGGRLHTELAVYYDRWVNGQVPSTVFYINALGTQSQSTVTTNVGRTKLYGFEAQAQMAVTRQFTVTGTMNYAGSKIQEYINLPNGPRVVGTANVTGNRFPNAPDWTWTLSPTYTDHLAGNWDWFGRADYRYKGKYMVDASNIAWIRPVNIVDLHLGVRNDGLEFEGYVKNLTNNADFLSANIGTDSLASATSSTSNEIRVTLPQKRQFGIKAKYKF
jgi:iron complex outermembrane receptor protein